MPRIAIVQYSPGSSLQLPLELDGSCGTNRAPEEHLQLSARNDWEAVLGWLMKFKDSPNTFDYYRREAERLLSWSINERKKPVSSLTYEDLLLYREFLADPPKDYISSRRFGRDNPGWRPFSGPLSKAAISQAFAAVGALFQHLVNAGYLYRNPVRLMRLKRPGRNQKTRRFLTDEMRQVVAEHIREMPTDSRERMARRARAIWIMSLFTRTGLRISEALGGSMGDFYCELREEREQWWLDVTGKGGKRRQVAVPQDVIEELRRYRVISGDITSALPQRGENAPLISRMRGQGPMGRGGLHRFIKALFVEIDGKLEAAGHPLAGQFTPVSTHWLRHTAATEWLRRGATIKDVQEQLGHGDISTTGQYLHSEDDRRHAAITGDQKAGNGSGNGGVGGASEDR